MLTKHVSNDSRGDNPNLAESEMIFKLRFFKSIDIQWTWLTEFKERSIIMGCEFDRNFPLNVSTNFVRFFYCNLEVGTLDNIEYTIDSRVRGKNTVLNYTILSEITKIVNTRECIIISKPSQLDQYVSKKTMYEVISVNGKIRFTDTKHLKKGV